MQGAAAEAEARAAAAEQAQQAAARQLAEVQASMAAQAAAFTAKYEPQLAELQQAADAATQSTEAAKRSVALGTLLPALGGAYSEGRVPKRAIAGDGLGVGH